MSALCREQSGLYPGGQSETREVYSLIEALNISADRNDRIQAIIRMGESGDPRFVSPLIPCCREKDSDVRRHAVEALHELRSGRAVPALLERLQDQREQPVIRKKAVDALSLVRTYSAIEGLKNQLRDSGEDKDIKKYISEALGRAWIR